MIFQTDEGKIVEVTSFGNGAIDFDTEGASVHLSPAQVAMLAGYLESLTERME